MRQGQRGSVVSTHLTDLPRLKTKSEATEIRRPKTRLAPYGVRGFGVSPFQLGIPALDAFPRTLWSRLTSSEARKFGDAELMYPDPRGLEQLRESITQYLALARGIHCTSDQVIVTSGYQGGLDLIRQLILQPADRVWLEDPGYFRAQQAILRSSAQAVPVGIDDEGLCVSEGVRLAPDARLAIVTPSHHSPTCVTLSLPRRMALLSWANAHRSWIVEDDYDGEFHYSGNLLPALKSLDTDGRVIYAGSFSKTLFPSLRLGYLVLPVSLVGKAEQAVQFRDGGIATLQQAVTARFMTEGHFTRHLKRMRTLYVRRRVVLAETLRDAFPGQFDVSLQAGGMNVIAALPKNLRDTVLADRAKESGFELQALSANALVDRGHNALIFGFTNVREEDAARLCRQLVKAIGTSFKR